MGDTTSVTYQHMDDSGTMQPVAPPAISPTPTPLEVLRQAREALSTCKFDGVYADEFSYDEDKVSEAITAIDKVLKGEG